MKTILLHTCCAPCSAAIIEWLPTEGFRPTLFFYNPNIYPQSEYDLRKSELVRYAEAKKIEVIDGDCNHAEWLQHVSGYEQEPERGARCMLCFKMRLLATAKLADERNIGEFATSLSSSRWKNLDRINEAGRWAAEKFSGVNFLEKNWRKGGLSERRIELLKQYAFYNQQYCGCEFSYKQKSFGGVLKTAHTQK
jgi:predicted adenine nucleotide alpha hydrolase (AANH) superfamily ATPase